MRVRLTEIALFLACLPLAALATDGVQIDTPVGGWRKGSDEGAHFMQEVNYPASSVNSAADQANTARIAGQITATPKDPGKPARLIVNGISMPLKVQEDGSFDRPFVFPSGSNSVEVRNPEGTAKHRVQFYNRGSGETAAKLRVVLSWDSDNTDLDLHVVTPDGGHVWYGERAVANGGALDVDVTTGFGPEMFASPTPLSGEYLVYVNYFGGGSDSDEYGAENPAQILTTAQVTVITQEGTANEKQESFIVPMRATGELTMVKRFAYP